MKLSINETAALEIRKHGYYYHEISAELRLNFLAEVKKTTDSILEMPYRWPNIERDLHRALLVRFPYQIYFRILDEDTIRIIAVTHQKQHPDFGKDRI